MSKKKNTPLIEPADLRTLIERFKDGESYVLATDVPNPACDKRRKYGSGLDCQGPVIAAGSRFVVTHSPDPGRRRMDVYFRQTGGRGGRGGDLRLSATLAYFDGAGFPELLDRDMSWLHYGHSNRNGEIMLAVIRGLVPEERSMATIEGLYRDNYSRMAWRALDALVRSGKIAVADVDAAIAGIFAADEAEDEAEDGPPT